MAPELVPLSVEAWAPAVAERLLGVVGRTPAARIVLPTGATPRPVYRHLVERPDAGAAFASATIILLDEWLGLAPGDPARCDVRLREDLLDGLAPSPRSVLIDVDTADPAAAAVAHDAVVASGIRLALLGLGGNGHVGFNEPGSGPASPTRVVDLAPSSRDAARTRYGAGSVPDRGITLGMDRLLAADELWLLVTGAHKADILARALDGPETTELPASYLRRHPRLVVLADTLAASQLGRAR